MAKWNKLIITDAGYQLSAQTLAEQKIQYTHAQTTDKDMSTMTSDQLKAITKLENVVQDLPVGTISVQDDHTVNIPVKVVNKDLTADYLLYGMALFAKPVNGDEILYGILTASQPDLIPAQTGATVTGTNFKLKVHVGDAANVNIVISPDGSVSNDELEGTLKNYVLGTDLDERFKNYYTKQEVDTTIGQLPSQTISDTRDVDWTPKRYMDNGVKITREFKSNTTLNLDDTGFSEVITDTPWSNSSGGFPFQIAKDTSNSKFFFRIGKSDDEWGAWTSLIPDLPSGLVSLSDDNTTVTAKTKDGAQIGIWVTQAKLDSLADDTNVVHRNPDTGKATDKVDFVQNDLTIEGNPAPVIVLVADKDAAIAGGKEHPTYAYVWGRPIE